MSSNLVVEMLLGTVSTPGNLDFALGYASRFHPVVVHFPIALSAAALFAEVISMLPRQRWAASASRFCILLAAAGAIAAMLSGWLKFTHGPMAGVAPDAATNLHRWVGTASGTLALVAASISIVQGFRPESSRWRWLYRAVLVLAASVVGLTGHLGGLLVFGSEHFSFTE